MTAIGVLPRASIVRCDACACLHLLTAGSTGHFNVTITGPVCDASAEEILAMGWDGVAAHHDLQDGLDAFRLPPLNRGWCDQALAACTNDKKAAIRWLALHAKELATRTGVGAHDAADMLAVDRGVFVGDASAFELSLHTAQLYLRRREVVPVPSSFRWHEDLDQLVGKAAASLKLRKSTKDAGAAAGLPTEPQAPPQEEEPVVMETSNDKRHPSTVDAGPTGTSPLCAIVGTQSQVRPARSGALPRRVLSPRGRYLTRAPALMTVCLTSAARLH